MGAEYTVLQFYCNSRWLSEDNVLVRVYEFGQKLNSYSNEEAHNYLNYFIDSDFVIKFTYLCDIFEKLNLFNISLQSKETHILKLYNKVVVFIKKVDLRQKKLTEGNEKTTCFPF